MLLLLFNNLRGALITECAPFSSLAPRLHISPHFSKFKL
nr:MAG TPA: hypothetical protein [Caudoviricetes sp.]